jgi:hypothetical protein
VFFNVHESPITSSDSTLLQEAQLESSDIQTQFHNEKAKQMITKDESSNKNSTLGFIHQMSEFATLWRVWTMTNTSEEVHLELCHPSELPSVLLPDRCSTYPNDSPQLQTRSESLRFHQCSTRERDLRRCTTCAGITPR